MKPERVALSIGRMVTDGVSLWGGMMIAYALRISPWHTLFALRAPMQHMPQFATAAMGVTSIIVGLFLLQGQYKTEHSARPLASEINTLFWGLSGAFGLVLLYFFFAKITFFSRFVFGAAWGLSFCLLILGRWLYRSFERNAMRHGFGQEDVVLLGSGDIYEQLKKAVADAPEFCCKAECANTQELEAYLKKNTVDEVLYASPDSNNNRAELMHLSHRHHARFRFVPDDQALDLSHITTETLSGLPIITLHATHITGSGVAAKALLDRVASAASLIFLSPILAFIAYRVKKECPNVPAVYTSMRIGKNAQPFPCYKFRTMVPNADQQKQALAEKNERGDILFKMENDPRITPLGAFLRKTSLDELPQLWNIAKGEMSFVGPRPHLPEEVLQYRPEDMRILSVKPGLTGWSQVNGRSKNSFADEMRYELYYLQHWSLWFDATIVWRTLWMVLRRENAS